MLRNICICLIFLIYSLSLSSPVCAQTEIVSKDAKQTHLTIYAGNLGLITEHRRVHLPKGKSRIIFENLSNEIIPQSLSLKAFEGFILERDFNVDLLSKPALFNKSIGKNVGLVRIDPNSGQTLTEIAKIINSDEQRGVVFDIEGKIEVLQCSGLSERVRFNGVPENLHPLPRLSLLVDSEEAGEADLVISYLSQGFSWTADYRVNMQTQDKANILGWMSVKNKTDLNLEDASLSVVAGNLNRHFEQPKLGVVTEMLYTSCWPKGSTKTDFDESLRFPQMKAVQYKARNVNQDGVNLPMMVPASSSQMVVAGKVVPTAYASVTVASKENLGDYKLYRVPHNLDLPSQSQKQIAFINESNVKVGAVYKARHSRSLYGHRPQPNPWETTPFSFSKFVTIDNSMDGSLATSLPAGTVRLFTLRTQNLLDYFGQGTIKNVVPDEPIEIGVEEPNDLKLHRLSRNVIVDGQDAVRVTYKIINPSARDVSAHIIEEHSLGPQSSVLDTSVEPIFIEGKTVWPVEVAAQSEAQINYSVLFSHHTTISLRSMYNDLLQNKSLKETITTNLQDYAHTFAIRPAVNIVGSISLPMRFGSLTPMSANNIEDIDECFPEVTSTKCANYEKNYQDIIGERGATKVSNGYNGKVAITLSTRLKKAGKDAQPKFDIEHQITNVTDRPQHVIIMSGNSLAKPFFKRFDILETNIPITDEQLKIWRMDIDPQETVNLEYTFEFRG